MKLQKLINITSYYLLPIVLLVLSIRQQTNVLFFITLGELTLLLLVIILFLKPLAIIIPSPLLRKALPLRRQLGVACFWIFLFHAGGMFFINRFTPSDFVGLDNYLFWGAVGGIGMILLGITSNSFSVRLLRKNWKRLHSIVYLILVAGLLHATLISQDFGKYGTVLLLFLLVKVIAWNVQRLRKKTAKTNEK